MNKKPYDAPKLPFKYSKDEEVYKLYIEATEKYAIYKSLLSSLSINKDFFLEALQKTESLRSSTIEGTQVSLDDLYFLDYKELNNDIIEVKNLKKTLMIGENYLRGLKEFDLELINNLHKELLSTGRGSNKKPGQIRDIQNYIGSISGVITFTPPEASKVKELLENLFEYMNDTLIEYPFINVAITHLQFETIHPYLDGNGRLGRVLIPLQLSYLKNEEVILYLSEIIDVYKTTYYKTLNESRKGNILPFIKFFLQCIAEQCEANIFKMKTVEEIFNSDKKQIYSKSTSTICKVHEYALKKIVFTTKEITEELNISVTNFNNAVKKMIDLGIIIKEKKKNTKRITFIYINMLNVFTNNLY